MRFFQRSTKYFLSLCVTYTVMLYLLSFTEMMVLTRGQTVNLIFSTPRGLFMLLAILALSAAYPYFGFMRRRLKCNMSHDRDIIIKAFEIRHFKILFEDENRMTFVADNIFRRLMMLFEDHIVVKQAGDEIEIRGNRKGVAYIVNNLEAALRRERELEAEMREKLLKQTAEDEAAQGAAGV